MEYVSTNAAGGPPASAGHAFSIFPYEGYAQSSDLAR